MEMYAVLWATRYETKYPRRSNGCMRYFLSDPSRISCAMLMASPGMLENMRLIWTRSRYEIIWWNENPRISSASEYTALHRRIVDNIGKNRRMVLMKKS